MTTIREQLNGDTMSKRQPIISGLVATTRTLNIQESGSLVFLDKTNGITITLPTSADIGTWFDFAVVATILSNTYKVITATPASEYIVGQIVSCATDNSNATTAYPALVGDANVSVNMDGTTMGGVKGDKFRLTKINSTSWLCDGNINASGVVATPFAAS